MRNTLGAYAFGALAGTLAAGGLAMLAFLPPALAQGAIATTLPQLISPAPVGTAIDPDSLVRIGEKTYSVDYEDWVDTAATDRVTVRKIAFGKTSFVTVSQTDSAVYSSEAMFSPHIRYPGVHVQRVRHEASPDVMAYWSERGWVAANVVDAGSFVLVPPSALGGGALVTDRQTCTFGETFVQC